MKDSINYIIRLLREERIKKKISQTALAKKIGIKQSHISKIESGKISPSLSIVTEIARTLELEMLLVPKKYVKAVTTIMQSKHLKHEEQQSAYTLKEDDDE